MDQEQAQVGKLMKSLGKVDKLELRIVSDGTPSGTRITDQFGTPIYNAVAISWNIDAKSQSSTVTLKLTNVPVSLNIPEQNVLICTDDLPQTSQVEKEVKEALIKLTPRAKIHLPESSFTENGIIREPFEWRDL